MKKNILYYSDCHFFAGCENMIANFLNSKELENKMNPILIYRQSKEYDEGLKKRINNISKIRGVNILGGIQWSKNKPSNIKFIFFLQKMWWFIKSVVLKYYCIYINIQILEQLFKEYNPDIIHINNGGYPAADSAQAAVIAAHKCGIKKIIYVVNNMAMDYKSPLRWLDILFDPIIKNYVTIFITGSYNAGKRLQNVLKLKDNQLVTIRNGVKIRKSITNSKEFKSKYDIPENKLIFSMIANLEERKGHIYLLKAIKYLIEVNKISNFYFLIEGKGILENYIQKFIIDNCLSNYVKLISVSNIYDLYNITDVVILPSICNEDFPNVIIESMGMGIPVIGTNIAGIPEQIDNNQNGLLIEPANVDELVSSIIEIGSNKVFRKTCGNNGKIKYNENYTEEISVRNYIKLYNNL